jgi:hypothetical protein
MSKEYMPFSVEGKRLAVLLNSPFETDNNPVNYFLAIVKEMFEDTLEKVNGTDMVGIDFYNEINHTKRPIGLSFRR